MTEVYGSMQQDELIVLKSLLDSAGIESEILAGSMLEIAPFFTIDSGGYRLCVSDEDAEDAQALVADHRQRTHHGGGKPSGVQGGEKK
jgi:hypothetical protein